MAFAISHIVTKKVVRDVDPIYLAYLKYVYVSLLSLPFIIILWDKFVINLNIIISLFVMSLIVTIAQALTMKGFKHGDISKTTPLLALTPLITLIIALVWLGELPSLFGIVGVVLMVIGVYLLNVEKNNLGFLAPFKALYDFKPSRYFLIVAIIYGFGSVLNKFIINNSNVITQLFFYPFFVIFIYTLFLLFKDKKRFIINTKKVFLSSCKGLLLIALIQFAVIVPQFFALELTYTAFVIAIKRAGIIFSVIMAYFIFKEKHNFWSNLLATIILIIGVVLITL